MSEQRELGLPEVDDAHHTGSNRRDLSADLRSGSMRRIGLLGGVSWHSSIEYYTKINDAVATMLAGHHSAQILLDSCDFAAILELQEANDWAGNDASLTATAQRLVDGGAEAVAIAPNLMHKCAPAIDASVDAPLIHIVASISLMAKRQDV